MTPKNTICLWFDKDALEAARFYAATFPNSEVTAVHKAPSDYPGGKNGDVLTVDFTVLGIPCIALNGGPTFKHSEAFSFQFMRTRPSRVVLRRRCSSRSSCRGRATPSCRRDDRTR